MASPSGVGWPSGPGPSVPVAATDESRLTVSGLGWPDGGAWHSPRPRSAGGGMTGAAKQEQGPPVAEQEQRTVKNVPTEEGEDAPVRVRRALSAAVSRESRPGGSSGQGVAPRGEVAWSRPGSASGKGGHPESGGMAAAAATVPAGQRDAGQRDAGQRDSGQGDSGQGPGAPATPDTGMGVTMDRAGGRFWSATGGGIQVADVGHVASAQQLTGAQYVGGSQQVTGAEHMPGAKPAPAQHAPGAQPGGSAQQGGRT